VKEAERKAERIPRLSGVVTGNVAAPPLQEMKNLLRRAFFSGMYRIFNPPDTGSCSRYDFAKYVLNQIDGQAYSLRKKF
jgi:dTDP-4-dehydrorhamnose reductase